MKLGSAFLWAAAVGSSAAQNYTRCATPNLPEAQAGELDALVAEDGSSLASLLAQAASVRTYVHVVTSTSKRGRYTQNMINNQIAAST